MESDEIGRLNKIRVGHDDAGFNAAWYLEKVGFSFMYLVILFGKHFLVNYASCLKMQTNHLAPLKRKFRPRNSLNTFLRIARLSGVRATFVIVHIQRFYEIQNTPLCILITFGTSFMSIRWFGRKINMLFFSVVFEKPFQCGLSLMS